MHFDDERAQRLFHGELAAPDQAVARAHLAECVPCRASFERIRRDEDRILASLRLLGHPASAVSPGAVIARARSEKLPWGRWVAVAVLATGLAGAATGSGALGADGAGSGFLTTASIQRRTGEPGIA